MTLEEIARQSLVGYHHTIIEPDGKEISIFSLSADNPWSHWVQNHRDQCKYSALALYSEDALRTVRNEALEEAAKAFREMRLIYHHQRVASGEIPAAQAAMFADDDAAQFKQAIRSLKESP